MKALEYVASAARHKWTGRQKAPHVLMVVQEGAGSEGVRLVCKVVPPASTSHDARLGSRFADPR